MTNLTIYVVDDERIVRVSVADDLRDKGHIVYEFSEAVTALSKISKKKHEVDIVITDLKMPQMDGIEFLSKIKKINPEITVIVMTAYGTVETAVKAIKSGAYDYITKPFQTEEILLMLDRINEMRAIKKRNIHLLSQIRSKYDFSSFVGKSKVLDEMFDLVKIAADSSSNVLIRGETGTGKELLTNIIHYNSDRKNQPLIKVSCAILSREIFESELFGHVKGAFTGADNVKQGRFELANKGTIYLDDIEDIPLDLQVKLLRVIEQQEVEKVGGMESVKIDTRIIASSKADLKELVDRGEFRQDLYYRLYVFPINIKPLREKKSDINDLIRYFVKEFSEGRDIKINDEVFDILNNYDWPGNVRELKNLVERLVLLAHDNIIDKNKIPAEIYDQRSQNLLSSIGDKSLSEILSEFEINAIKIALAKNNNNKNKASEFLGIPPSTLKTKINKYGIE